MKINDLEKLTDLKRSNIFYYEREGLLRPRREDNNYREYSQEDLRRLKTIVVFRKLGFSVAEIKELIDGERELSDILPENIARLEAKAGEVGEAMALCRRMEQQDLTMARFDPDPWLAAIQEEERQGKHFMDMLSDAADDFTRTLAFVQDTIGLRGPIYYNFFLTEEAIKKRRLWKLYWALCLGGYLLLLAETYLLPGHYVRLVSPGAALVFTLLDGVIGSLALVFCARYVIPGRTPRRAFWLTVALVMCVNTGTNLVGRQVYRTEVDREVQAQWLFETGRGDYIGEDPLGYVQRHFNEKYHGGRGELDVWEQGDLLFVFTSWGDNFRFYRTDSGLWEENSLAAPVGGVLYTADPYGPRKYPSRLMLAGGTSVAPVYEARFSNGFTPLYAFDVSAGQTYIGLEYGVDEDGSIRYELDRSSWGGASDWTPPIDDGERKWTHRVEEVLETAGGVDFLRAYGAWRAGLWTEEPAFVRDTAELGASSKYALYATYTAPPSLVVTQEEGVLRDVWGLNQFGDILYFGDQGPYLQWQMTCQADVAGLVTAETVTPAMLRAAAGTVSGDAEYFFTPEGRVFLLDAISSYTATRYWKTDVLGELRTLGEEVFRALNGAG